MQILSNKELRNVIGKYENDRNTYNALLEILYYVSGIGGFDNKLKRQSRKNFKVIIDFLNRTKGIEIRLNRLIISYSIGIPYSDIREISLYIDCLDILLKNGELITLSFDYEDRYDVLKYLEQYINDHLMLKMKVELYTKERSKEVEKEKRASYRKRRINLLAKVFRSMIYDLKVKGK